MEEKNETGTSSIGEQAIAVAHDYLEKFMSEHTHFLTLKFIREAQDLLRNVRLGGAIGPNQNVLIRGASSFRGVWI